MRRESRREPAARAGADLRANERRVEIIEAAGALFAERGFRATSMRDIAERVGLLGGSLYHHLKSKEALFVEAHALALQRAALRLETAVAAFENPWERLEAACVQLLEMQLDPRSLTMPLTNDFRAVSKDARAELIETRGAFETIFVRLVRDLPLEAGLDRDVYRLLLLGLLNNVGSWYRPGRHSPAEIGRQIMRIFRRDATGEAAAQAAGGKAR